MITGKYQVDILHEGQMLVDGGIAFAGIPRSEWQTFAPPDANNRVRFGLNQLLVRGPGLNMLVDTGMGDKIRPRKRELMGLSDSSQMRERLAALGVAPDDITHVVLSHLHYDHCGGATEVAGDSIKPVFKNAFYYIQKNEWKAAVNPDEISRSSYCIHDFLPLHENNRLKLINDDVEIAEGIFLEVSGGHTAAHQIIRIHDSSFRVVFPGDICPTPFHLSPERREAFDLFPGDTLQARKLLIKRGQRPDTLIVFSHACSGNFFKLVTGQNGLEARAFHET
ncbi:MAG: MBL fold metallo-hydrolase [Candidatus Riflebacteria bacterium]|nr:MBL fold metallo-hydrolase [Candidatus Riflebacteria bacterium]